MFDIGSMMQLAWWSLEVKAKAEGREVDVEEYKANLQKIWDAWMDASVARDMSAAGFVKTETGWKPPRRGFFARLFGRA